MAKVGEQKETLPRARVPAAGGVRVVGHARGTGSAESSTQDSYPAQDTSQRLCALRAARRESADTPRGAASSQREIPETLNVVAGSATEPSGAAPSLGSHNGQHHLQDGFDSVDHLDEKFRKNEPLQIL